MKKKDRIKSLEREYSFLKLILKQDQLELDKALKHWKDRLKEQYKVLDGKIKELSDRLEKLEPLSFKADEACLDKSGDRIEEIVKKPSLYTNITDMDLRSFTDKNIGLIDSDRLEKKEASKGMSIKERVVGMDAHEYEIQKKEEPTQIDKLKEKGLIHPEAFEENEPKHSIEGNNHIRENLRYNTEEPKAITCYEDLETVYGCRVGDHSLVADENEWFANNSNKNVFPTEAMAEASIAMAQLAQLMRHKQYNGEDQDDWYNGQEAWRIGWSFGLEAGEMFYTRVISHVKRFLIFKTESIAKLFFKNHLDLIQTAKPLL